MANSSLQRLKAISRPVLRAAALAAGFLFLLSTLIPAVGQFLIATFFGWAIYPWQTLPHIEFNAEIALDAALTLALAVAALHGVLRWWHRSAEIAAPRWPFRATVKIAVMILLLFATSIAATGIIRQTGWLLSLQHPVSMMHGEDSIVFGVKWALTAFADDHQGNLPVALDELAPNYLYGKRSLYGGFSGGDPPEQFRYFSGYRPNIDPPDRILLASPYPRGDRRVIVRLGGGVELVSEMQFQELLAQQHRSETED